MTQTSVNKIAVFRALYLGDMLCIIPTVRAIRAAFPSAQISLVGLPWQADLIKRFPQYFDRLISFPGWPGLPEQPVNPRQIVSFLADMQREAFDLIFQLQGNGALTNAMCMLWGGRKVSGLRKAEEYSPEPGLFPVSEDGEHEVLRFLKVCDCLNIPRVGTHLEFRILPEEKTRLAKILSVAGLADGRYVCLHPGARDPRRRWPAENFARLANALASHGYTPVLTGSGDEKSLLKEVSARIDVPVVNIVENFGHLSAGELAALLQRAALLISNDTGVSHVAAALQLPSVIIFSPYADIDRWRPLDRVSHVAIPFAEATDVHHVWNVIKPLLPARAMSAIKSTV
jgi:ADP-heptose:LPS heptosyltransferase